MHKAGFVSIVGMPNAGKSTLYNALMEEKLAIVNNKAQTTRHRILGIKNTDQFQIVFSDTPGFLKKISYEMHNKMMHSIEQSLTDSDVLVLVIDVNEKNISENLVEQFNKISTKKILCLNKIDTTKQEILESKLIELKTNYVADVYLPISAMEKFNLNVLENYIVEFLPEHPPYFPKDQLTDRSERFFVNEIIRNNILKLYDEEIPYACEVLTLMFKEESKIIRMSCEVVVERESQKGIVIGNKGMAIKELGTKSRLQLEEFFQKKVFLELFVKVRKDWRNNLNLLKQYGYDFE